MNTTTVNQITLFRTTSGTTYLFNHGTGVLSSERVTGLVVEVVAVDDFYINVSERAVIIGKHPDNVVGSDRPWSLNTSPVVWMATYDTVTRPLPVA